MSGGREGVTPPRRPAGPWRPGAPASSSRSSASSAGGHATEPPSGYHDWCLVTGKCGLPGFLVSRTVCKPPYTTMNEDGQPPIHTKEIPGRPKASFAPKHTPSARPERIRASGACGPGVRQNSVSEVTSRSDIPHGPSLPPPPLPLLDWWIWTTSKPKSHAVGQGDVPLQPSEQTSLTTTTTTTVDGGGRARARRGWRTCCGAAASAPS